MSVDHIVGNIQFIHPEPHESDPVLMGNEYASLFIYSVTFDSVVLAKAPPHDEWTRKDIYAALRGVMPLIYCLGRVEIYLGVDQIGTSLLRSRSRA